MWERGDDRFATEHFREGLLLSRDWGPTFVVYFCLLRLGDIARTHGALEDAAVLLAESRALSQAAGDRYGSSRTLHSLAYLRLAQGDRTAARLDLEEAMRHSLDLEDARGVSQTLDGLACLASAEGDVKRAVRIFGAAEALRLPYGYVLSPVAEADRFPALAACRERLGDGGFAAQWAAGQAMSMEQVLEDALNRRPPPGFQMARGSRLD